MMQKKKRCVSVQNIRRILAGVCALLCLGLPSGLFAQAEEPGQDMTLEGAAAAGSRDTSSYTAYLDGNSGRPMAAQTAIVPVSEFIDAQGEVEIRTGIADAPASQALYTSEDSSVTWEVQIPASGLYALKLRYYTIEGKGSAMERALHIDGELPFSEAETLTFSRVWEDDGKVRTDYQGNDVRPTAREVHCWQTEYARDSSGYQNESFLFYLEAGSHTLTLVASREPMVIGEMAFTPPETIPTYAHKQAEYQQEKYPDATQDTKKIQAEAMLCRSDKSIYPTASKTSAAMEPVSAGTEKLNILDGSKFKLPGQWVRWELDVEQSGLYQIAVRYRQSDRDGAYCSRRLLIDGKVPFSEAASLKFSYSDQWDVCWLADESGTPYRFYLTGGKKHTIELQVTLGDMAEMVGEVEDIMTALNDCYREIFVITGSDADPYRDYHFAELIPDTLKELGVQRDRLKDVLKKLEEETKENGSFTSVLNNVLFDVTSMVESPRKLATKMETFKSDLGALGEWLQDAINQPIGLDWIWVMSPQRELPAKDKGFFAELWHQCRLFFYSFTADYASIGKFEQDGQGEEIKVWITSGRDQSKIIRRMIDQDFTPSKGISVNLQLVAGGTLLRSVLAGNGPDVAMQLATTEPLNYALRMAVKDLRGFDDFEDITKRFNRNAIKPFEYRGAVYALPETFSYPMMFVRTDIFEEMGLVVPETWDDVYSLIVLLSASNMKFGLPFNVSTYTTMFVQQGLEFYNEERTAVNTVSDEALQVFSEWVSYYRDYGLDVTYDFANRFRTGEMPIGIIDFVSTYNQLSVFAPEIRGQWTFVEIPGTRRADGTVDHTTMATGTAISIMSSTKSPDASWEFLKWWTDANAQVEYGTELESILGAAARYASANIDAVARTAWPVKEYRNIMQQWEHADCLPQAPGSYIVSRYVDFAARAVINDGADAGQSMIKYTKLINSELERKKKEFMFNE